MAKFGVKIYGADAIIKRLNAAPKKMMEESKLIIDAAVIEIASKAKQKVAVKTGALKNSIRHAKYQPGVGASVSAGNTNVRYAPYVEFGTGTRFQIPVYPNVNMADLESYALTFKKSKKVIGVPYRPYMFSAYSEVFTSMIKKLKSVKI
jgi:HK97 gp10 family phage protein